MRILVTGATGFIGRAFCKLALEKGHEIGALLLPSETPPVQLHENSKIIWLRGSLEAPPWPEVNAFQPQSCLHLAWIATPGIYLESPANEDFFNTSLTFATQARAIGVKHFCVAGTCIEYRIVDGLLSEIRTPIEPTTRYAKWKNELRLALETQNFPFAWGRVFYPYGPGEHPERLCSSIISKLAQREQVILKTPGSTKDYIYVDDVASAFLKILETHFLGIVNIGTGVGVSVREIASNIGHLMGTPELVSELKPAKNDAFGNVVADAGRLRGLGWQPTSTLLEGLQNLIASRSRALPT
jgi:nucleoside-diphosphate-sugar epimerase